MSCKLPNNEPLPDFRGRLFGNEGEERIFRIKIKFCISNLIVNCRNFPSFFFQRRGVPLTRDGVVID